MKDNFITFKVFLPIYLFVLIIDFSIPFFLPSRVIGAYLFWILLPIITFILVIFFLERRKHFE
ncbi:MAG: hypothetical protein DRP57_02845 [Spirochaetes bacterium]|nr:MAG: hypothetical protein DRP57_02845 [Spirochaetota bacterium]